MIQQEARLACVSASWTATARLHVGNVAWTAAGGDGSPPPDCSRLWGDPLLGFADIWLDDGQAEVALHVDPGSPAGVHDQIVREVAELAPKVAVEASRQDARLVTALTASGFIEQDGPWYVQLWRGLSDLSDLGHAVPPGYRVRATRPAEVVERIELHRRCWAPARIKSLLGLPVTGDEPGSGYNLEKHRLVMSSPVYRPALDMVVEAPDGSLCAYGIGWFDSFSRSVLFEPIGTDPAYAGRGLARVVCAEIMRAAADLGAICAVVGPRGDRAYSVPRRVYQGLGMDEIAQHVEYCRRE